MFTEASFLSVKNQKQPRCPTVGVGGTRLPASQVTVQPGKPAVRKTAEQNTQFRMWKWTWLIIPIWTNEDAGKDSEEASFWDCWWLSPCAYLPSFLEHAVRTPSKHSGAGCLFLTPAPIPTGVTTVGKCRNHSVPQFPVCLLWEVSNILT